MGLFRALAAIGVNMGESNGALEKKISADHVEVSV